MAVYVFVVCMYVSVWCGVAPLSLSLWIVAGMVVGWQDSRAEGEDPWPDCNNGVAAELEEDIAGQGGSFQPTAISLYTLTYPAAFDHHAL